VWLCVGMATKPVFQGAVADVLPHFDSQGYPCPQHYNPAEHISDLIADDFSQASVGFQAAYRNASFTSPSNIEPSAKYHSVSGAASRQLVAPHGCCSPAWRVDTPASPVLPLEGAGRSGARQPESRV